MREPHDFPNPAEQLLGLRAASYVDIISRVIHNILHFMKEGSSEFCCCFAELSSLVHPMIGTPGKLPDKGLYG